MSENNLALYRKYRPASFDDVVGQDHIVSVLQGAIEKGQVAHAYLFSGTRGTGKTSVARIVARELKVEGSDLYEIDAASNRGIDDIRELRESVNTLPFSSPYKIYIIDEAHMLTKEAWNALLKTLEEPPAYVIFILATTEIEKVPDTILSRCQTFAFKTPSRTMLSETLRAVAKKEKITLPADAAELIALSADGSYRDALGILQKVLTATSNTTVTADEVALIVEAPKTAHINRTLSALSKGNTEEVLATYAEALESGVKVLLFVELLLEKMRAVLLLRLAPRMATKIESMHSPDDFALLETLAKENPSTINAKALDALLEAAIRAHRSSLPEIAIESGLIAILEQHPKA